MSTRSLSLPVVTLAAMTALGGSAFAAGPAPGVSISGYLDLGLYRGFDGDDHLGTIKRSSITFSGAEDIGGGTSVIFKLQHRFDLDNGSVEATGKPFWHGESTVGLRGAFGTLRLGRALNVVSNNDWAFDPWGNFDRIASPAWNTWHWNFASDRTSNSGGAEYGRLDNGIFYDSPNWNGLSIHLSGSFEDSAGAGGGTKDNGGLALNYRRGPAAAMAAYSNNSSGDTVAFLGGSWSLGDLTLMAAWDRSVYKATTDSVAKVATVGATYAMGAATLKAGYGRLDVDGAKTGFLGLGADYALSKRSSVYLSFGRSDPSNARADNAYGLGLSHAF